MDKNFIFITNWKMKLNFDEEINFVTSNYDAFIQLSETNNSKIVLCPSFISIYPLIQMFKETNIEIGAQDCSKHNKGAFTGQIPAQSLSLLGCKYCIIGHSERRKENHETNYDITQKFIQLTSYKISPILCIGESLEEFEKGKAINVLTNQLQEITQKINSDLKISYYLPVYIAYEPIWSIGTGKIPTLDHLETIFSWLFNQTQKISNSTNWKLLYGGSVNNENIKNIKKVQNLDGFLVGGASLDFQEFKKMVKS